MPAARSIAPAPAEERRDLPGPSPPLARDAVGVHASSIFRRSALRDVELLELDTRVTRHARHRPFDGRRRRLARRACRSTPELRADVTRGQAGEIGHACSLAQIVGVDVIGGRVFAECAMESL